MNFFLFVILVCFTCHSYACTSAIISGKVTKDGRPLMWKHFDNERQLNKKVLYLSGGRYSAMAIVNAGYKENKTIWMGYNSAGFAIMSTDSGNLWDSVRVETNMSGVFMKEALLNCASVEEFEFFLKNYPKPHSFRVNFGVIDATGSGVYFETNNFTYVRYDVNDEKVAPHGYLIRTNYSFAGLPNRGHGYIRYKTTEELFEQRRSGYNLDLRFLLNSVCLSLDNSLTGKWMNEFEHLHNGEANYIYVQDCINRYSTGASAVIHGVKEGEKSLYTTMWTMLGFPLTSVPVPVWLTSEGVLPSIMMGCATKEAVMCNMSLRLKKEIIASSRGEMKYYINTTKVVNSEGLGCSQRLAPVRRKVFERGMKLREGMEKGFLKEKDIISYYEWIDIYLVEKYDDISFIYR